MKGVFIPEISVEMLKNASLESIEDFFSRILNDGNVAIWDAELPQWIPVTEKLPEDGLYIVTTSKGQVQVHVFSHNGNSEEYWMRCNRAWMPLPPAYRGEDDE